MSCMCPHDVDCEMVRKVEEAERAIEGTEKERDEAWQRAEKAEAEAARLAAALERYGVHTPQCALTPQGADHAIGAALPPGPCSCGLDNALAAAPQARELGEAVREHDRNCPALQAWDIPEACQCWRTRR